MRLFTPMLLVLLGAAPASEDVPALLRARTEQLLDAITRGDPSVVHCETDGLTGGLPGKAGKPLRMESPDVFFVPGEPRTRRLFQRDATGRVTGFVERRESWDLRWTRVD